MSVVSTNPIDADFGRRVKRVEKRRNSKLIQGYLMSDNVDGIAIARVRGRQPASPLRAIVVAALAVVVLKTAFVAATGAATYDERIARLADGTGAERLAAFVLQADPLTAVLAGKVTSLME